ncbi:MAG TPA: RidA family protein [Dehalococcoidia bacterium]|nr:RidA family protein [Dehalococcoidia bacterium]
MTAEEKAKELGLDLSNPSAPVAAYVSAVRTGNLVFLSGTIPVRADGSRIEGKVGADLTLEQGYDAARLTAVGLLARLRAEVGSLDKVQRIVKLTGFINAPPEFTQHPQVMNGASDLMGEVFGDAGRHARAAVGMGSLPFNVAVEIEMVAEVE